MDLISLHTISRGPIGPSIERSLNTPDLRNLKWEMSREYRLKVNIANQVALNSRGVAPRPIIKG